MIIICTYKAIDEHNLKQKQLIVTPPDLILSQKCMPSTVQRKERVTKYNLYCIGYSPAMPVGKVETTKIHLTVSLTQLIFPAPKFTW